MEHMPQADASCQSRAGIARQLQPSGEARDRTQADKQAQAIERIYADADVMHSVELRHLVAVVVRRHRLGGGHAGRWRAARRRGVAAIRVGLLGRHEGPIGKGDVNLIERRGICGARHSLRLGSLSEEGKHHD